MKKARKKKPPIPILNTDEAVQVLSEVVKQHPDLQEEINRIALSQIGLVSTRNVAKEVTTRFAGIGDDRIIAWSARNQIEYCEPDEMIWAIFEESLEDLLEDMKRRFKAGVPSAAEKVCAGILIGLYEIRIPPDGVDIPWAEEYPIESAAEALFSFIRLFSPTGRKDAANHLLGVIEGQVPEWEKMVSSVLKKAISSKRKR